VLDAWGRRNRRVSPMRGHPKLPLGALGFRSNGRKWLRTKARSAARSITRADSTSSPTIIPHVPVSSHDFTSMDDEPAILPTSLLSLCECFTCSMPVELTPVPRSLSLSMEWKVRGKLYSRRSKAAGRILAKGEEGKERKRNIYKVAV
jgi:hypothetical protein